MQINITVPGSADVPAYVALADGSAGPRPGVVVVHEAYGLNDDIRAIADRFAAAGYHAIAPDLFAQGSAPRCFMAALGALRRGDGRQFEELLAARDWLQTQDNCTGRVGVIGFCMGGGFALLLANRGFDVSSVNYGMLPKEPVRALAGACPIVASYGGRDRSLSGAAAKLEAALTELEVEHDVKEYPEAGHSFIGHADPPWFLKPTSGLIHAGYVDTAAEHAWTRILAMFESALTPAS